MKVYRAGFNMKSALFLKQLFLLKIKTYGTLNRRNQEIEWGFQIV